MTISEVMLEWNFRIGHVFSNSLFYGLRIWGKYVTLSYLGKKWLAFGKMRNSTFHLLNPCFCHTNSHLQSPSCPYVFPSSISYTMENFVYRGLLQKQSILLHVGSHCCLTISILSSHLLPSALPLVVTSGLSAHTSNSLLTLSILTK